MLAESLPLMSVCDLSGSIRITNEALEHLTTCSYLRVVNIDRCPGVRNEGIAKLALLHERLEGLSMVGLVNVSDEGLLPVALACKSLYFININNCSNISDITIEG